jgi:hypothetical protein
MVAGRVVWIEKKPYIIAMGSEEMDVVIHYFPVGAEQTVAVGQRG